MKKPTIPGLLGDSNSAKIYQKQYNLYKKELLELIEAESGFSDPKDLVVYLVEQYHPRLRIKQKVGAKTKWSDFLNSALAVEVDTLRGLLLTRKSALEALIEISPWKRLVINSKDPFGLFDKADKAGRKSKVYRVLKDARLYSVEFNQLPSYIKTINSLVLDAVRKN